MFLHKLFCGSLFLFLPNEKFFTKSFLIFIYCCETCLALPVLAMGASTARRHPPRGSVHRGSKSPGLAVVKTLDPNPRTSFARGSDGPGRASTPLPVWKLAQRTFRGDLEAERGRSR